jgi:hypothetical protein
MLEIPPLGKQRARALRRGFSDGTAALAVAGAVSSPLSGPLLVTAALMAALTWKVDDLASGAPRSDWDQTADIERRHLPVDLFPSDGRGAQAVAELASILLSADANIFAARVALERAQGAALNGADEIAVARQREALVIFRMCADSLRGGSSTLTVLARDTPRRVRALPLAGVPRTLDAFPLPAVRFFRDVGMGSRDSTLLAAALRRRPFLLGSTRRHFLQSEARMRAFADFLTHWTNDSEQ